MSFDRRLRSRLERLAGEIDPDVEDRLQRTIRSAGRRGRARAGALVLLESSLALVVLAAVIGLSVRPQPGVGASPIPQPSLGGMWMRTLQSTDQSITRNGMNGPWVIALPSTGVLDVSAPGSYVGPSSGYTFQVTGDTIRTDLLGADVCSGLPPGSYHWAIQAEDLIFSTVSDSCRGRVILFTSSPWTQADGG